jgi:hypothetical protein
VPPSADLEAAGTSKTADGPTDAATIAAATPLDVVAGPDPAGDDRSRPEPPSTTG